MKAILDNGGVSAVVPVDEKSRALLREMRHRCTDIVLPAAVLTESIFRGNVGYDHRAQQLLETLGVVAIDRDLGKAAGVLRHQVLASKAATPSGVDAAVVAVADVVATDGEVIVVTSDPGDLELLAACASNGGRMSVVSV